MTPPAATSCSRDARSSVVRRIVLPDWEFGRTFQNLALFHNLSVFENVRIGGHSRSRCDYLSDALQLPWKRRNEQTLGRKAREIMDYLDLTRVAFDRAGNLPFGVQKKVELARALAMEPTDLPHPALGQDLTPPAA